MRIGRRRLGAAIAGLLLIVLVAIAFVRFRAAGVAHVIAPPAGAVTQLPEGNGYKTVVVDRAHIVALGLFNDRGPATVHTYVLPPKSPWLQSRKIVATQLDHWEQTAPS